MINHENLWDPLLIIIDPKLISLDLQNNTIRISDSLNLPIKMSLTQQSLAYSSKQQVYRGKDTCILVVDEAAPIVNTNPD